MGKDLGKLVSGVGDEKIINTIWDKRSPEATDRRLEQLDKKPRSRTYKKTGQELPSLVSAAYTPK